MSKAYIDGRYEEIAEEIVDNDIIEEEPTIDERVSAIEKAIVDLALNQMGVE